LMVWVFHIGRLQSGLQAKWRSCQLVRRTCACISTNTDTSSQSLVPSYPREDSDAPQVNEGTVLSMRSSGELAIIRPQTAGGSGDSHQPYACLSSPGFRTWDV
jgi:hypothetical protein